MVVRGDACVGPGYIEFGGADVLIGEAYCDEGASREAGPPSIEEIDMLLPPVLGGRPKGGNDGSSRPDGKDVGGPTDTGGGLGGGGP